jgi:signal transduction histidine kinase
MERHLMSENPAAAPGTGRGAGGRMTVQSWVNLVLTGMGVLVLTAIVVVTVLLTRSSAASDQLTERVLPAGSDAFQLQSALVSQQSALRGYVVTGNPDSLRAYRSNVAAESAAAKRLGKLVPGIPGASDDLRALRDAARTWREERAQPLIEKVQREGPGAVDADEAGRTSFAPVRELLSVQNAHLAEARQQARADAGAARDLRDLVLWGLVGVLLAALTGLAVLLHALLVRPLNDLRTDVRKVTSGAFRRRITPTGPADLRAVAGDVDQMRRRFVDALEESRTQQEQLSRQAAALDARAEELERSNAELEQFAYVASHDLQEPLRKVASFCQLLEKRYGEKLDERGVQYIAFAVDGAKRMQVLINDLLTFSRVGRVNDTRVDVGLGGPLDKALDNIAAQIEETGARIERPAELPQIVGDPTLLTMLWQNLVGNAVKFRAPGRDPEVRITAEPYEDDAGAAGWRFAVADNGIGIPEEFADKIFVIFQRLHGRDAYAGTGIGLALCKKIVEYHGGRIWLDSPEGDGARICFTLLGAADSPAALQTRTSPTASDVIPAQPGATA